MDFSFTWWVSLELPGLKEGGNSQDKRPRQIQIYSTPAVLFLCVKQVKAFRPRPTTPRDCAESPPVQSEHDRALSFIPPRMRDEGQVTQAALWLTAMATCS